MYRTKFFFLALLAGLTLFLLTPIAHTSAQENVLIPVEPQQNFEDGIDTEGTAVATCPAPTPQALLAGDSWAQFMWDDGSHNDIFDKFGHADKEMISRSLDSDPGPGYEGPEYAISGSEALHWANTGSYPWIANMAADLAANPTINTVVLSIDGNDVLAGKPEGGWYKDMDLDVPGSEDALFDRIETDTFTIINAIHAVRPDIEVIISSYDYPNFNVGFWCFVYACPKREALSRDPVNDLITDIELNAMMVNVEQRRIGWTNNDSRLFFDNSIGLMHYYYGDGVNAPGELPYPGTTPPDYLPFPGGNPDRPTLRENFRLYSGFIDADPIHLDYDGYQYKISNQTMTYFFPKFRGTPTQTFFSQGGSNDGWSDGTSFGTDSVYVGYVGGSSRAGIISIDTSALPDNAIVTNASLYVMRDSGSGTSPFQSGALGTPSLDIATGSFGAPSVEAADDTAAADAADAGCFNGTARQDDYAVRMDLTTEGLTAVNPTGLTQFRLRFPNSPSSGNPAVWFNDGDSALRSGDKRLVWQIKKFVERMPDGRLVEVERAVLAIEHQGLAEYMGSPRPFLDVTYCTPPQTINQVTIDQANNDVLLTWDSVVDAQFYDVWQSNADPYLMPGLDCAGDGMCTAVVTTNYTDSDIFGTAPYAVYYTVVPRNDCGGVATGAATSPVGVFSFAIEAGS